MWRLGFPIFPRWPLTFINSLFSIRVWRYWIGQFNWWVKDEDEELPCLSLSICLVPRSGEYCYSLKPKMTYFRWFKQHWIIVRLGYIAHKITANYILHKFIALLVRIHNFFKCLHVIHCSSFICKASLLSVLFLNDV